MSRARTDKSPLNKDAPIRHPAASIPRRAPRRSAQGRSRALDAGRELWNQPAASNKFLAPVVKHYLLPYPYLLANGEWVTAVSGSALAVHPTYWKLWVETPTRTRTRTPPPRTGVMNSRGFADRQPSGKRMRHIIE